MVQNQVEYDVWLWAQRDLMRDQLIGARLQKQAAQRSYKLVPIEGAYAEYEFGEYEFGVG